MYHTHTTTLTGITMHHLQGVHVSHTHNHSHWDSHVPPPRCTCITHTQPLSLGYPCTTSKVYMYHTHTTTLTGIPMHHLQGVHVSYTHNHSHWDNHAPPPRCTCITHTQPHSLGYPCTTSKVYMYHTHTTTLTGIAMYHLQGVHVSHTHNHSHWDSHVPPPRCTCITHTQPLSLG